MRGRIRFYALSAKPYEVRAVDIKPVFTLARLAPC